MMEMDIVALISALGGLELVKWGATSWINRKQNRRIKESEADVVEFHTLTESLQFLQAQLKEKEERFAEQTQLVRKLNTEVIDLTKQKASVELELMAVRCDDRPCPYRQPPNAYTPPKQGVDRDGYHAKRKEERHGKD